MAYILSVYSANAFKEFLLPAVNDADSSIIITKSIFGLPTDVEISLEIIGNQWFFKKDDNFSLVYTSTKEQYGQLPIQNGDLLTITLSTGHILNIIVKVLDNAFKVYKKYNIQNLDVLKIGKKEGNDIQCGTLKWISGEHGVIHKDGNQYVLEDLSSNGIFVNNVRMSGRWQLSFGDCIDIYGLRIVFLGQFIAVNMGIEGLYVNEKILKPFRMDENVVGEKEKNKRFLFHRSPRKICKLDNDVVEIEAPPEPKEEEKQPLAMVIGPSLTMALPMLLGCGLAIYGTQQSGGSSGMFMYTGLVTAVSSAMIGTVWTLVNMKYSKKKNKELEMRRFQLYNNYLLKCTDIINQKYENNASALREMYPSAEECCNYNEHTSNLWNRNISHDDVLFERLGIGDVPFQVTVEIPKDKFSMIYDELAERPAQIRETYYMLHEVPVGVDLFRHRLLGVFGGEKKGGAVSVVYNLVAQVAANNCYTDVKMAFIYDEKKYEDAAIWNFAKWLPHVWSEDKKTRFIAKDKSEASDVLYEITRVMRMRAEASESYRRKEKFFRPYYILFVADQELLEGELISKYIFETNEEYGLTTIILAENYEQLPNTCEYLIQNDSSFQGTYSIGAATSEKVAIRFDSIDSDALETFGRRLSNIDVNEVETGGEIPTSLSFFEMYGINRLDDLKIIDRWRKNRTYESMKALVGQKSGGLDCYLDIHEKYHGPHGLVAGTTGSGKSETLQTYMLSLAINFSPDDVGFFVIDYKGGGMANLFSGLPHMIGQISNLSGNQVRRAMVSIKSENMRRQRIFNEYGVNNINLYTKLYKNNEASLPIPHLLIIIDEFAELKREEPDFMRELISVAQVGRSLGVHLILATQKPSGTVDDNIWSNSKFKLCLRVQDRQDSNDMLHKPDAAYITQAGRCYLQVGNDELYELFQSGFSGAGYDDDVASSKTDIARMLANTGKAALVGSRAKIKQKESKKRNWIKTIVAQFRVAANELGMSFENDMLDLSNREKMIQRTFQLLAEKKIEYPLSEYNVHRLEDLLYVYMTFSMENNENVSLDECIDRIIMLAGKLGRKLPEQKEKTQLDAVVEYLDKVAKENGYNHNLQLWLPVLPTALYLDELEGYKQATYTAHKWPEKAKSWNLSIYMGLCDDPVNQAQMPLILDLSENGHHAICGTVVSGKSTFLQTFVYSLINKYTPDDVNIYGIDFGSKMLAAFEKAPHVGGIVYENEAEKLGKFFTMLTTILSERKEIFRGGNYSQYVQANGVIIPAIVVVIDDFGNFRSKTNNMYDDLFVQLSKEGVGFGIFIVTTAGGFGTLEIPNRIGDNFRTVISLEMGDKFQYADVMRTLHIEVMPEENVKGRGLVRMGESLLEYQTALALRAEDDFKRSEMIVQLAEDMGNAWKGKRAKAIPEIPEKLIWVDFAQTEEVQKMVRDDRRLPIGYDQRTVAVYGIDLSKTYCYLLSGKSRYGKTNMMKNIMQSAALKGGRIIVIDFAEELKAACDKLEVTFINDEKTLYHYIKDELITIFKERNVQKKAWLAEDISDEELYQNMNTKEKIYIFIANMADFIKRIYAPSDGLGVMNPTIENLLDKGNLHSIYWFGCLKQEDVNSVAGTKAFELFIRSKRGVHFGGNVSAQRIFNFDYIPYMEQSKGEKVGVAMLPSAEEETVRKVVIPLYKG